MRDAFGDSRPDNTSHFFIDSDDRFPDHHSVAESHDARAGLHSRVNDEARYQTGMKGAEIPKRMPSLLRTSVREDLLTKRSHFGSPASCTRCGRRDAE